MSGGFGKRCGESGDDQEINTTHLRRGGRGYLDDVSIQRPQVATSCAFAGSFAKSKTRCASLPPGAGAIRGLASETILPCVEKGGLLGPIRQVQTISTLHFQGWIDPPKDVQTSIKRKLAEEFVNFWREISSKSAQMAPRPHKGFPSKGLSWVPAARS